MLYKVLAIAAVAAAPMIAHAQGTTSTAQTQDTTAMGHNKMQHDSTMMAQKKAKNHGGSMRDSTRMHTRTRADSSMNVSPVDSARMGIPSTKQTSTPPR